MTPEILARLRAAINDDSRTTNAIAIEARVSPTNLYRFMEGFEVTTKTATKLGEVVGLRIEVVCEEMGK